MTPLEIQNLQTRQYESTKDIVFPSVVSVFQDLSYIIKTADKDTGIITAESVVVDLCPSGFLCRMKRTTYEQFVGTAFIEKIGKMTQVRLNIISKRSSPEVTYPDYDYATESNTTHTAPATKKETPILDANVYQKVFERIENAIFIRSGI